MKGSYINTEPMSTTRDTILRMLVRQPCAVDDLAEKLSLTKNAVRAQIAVLQQEGIVEAQGSVKRARRPAVLYGLSAGSDIYFSKAYPTVLSHLVRVLADKLSPDEFKAVMQELGWRLAAQAPRPSGSPQERIQSALKFLRGLGSQAEITEKDGKVIVGSFICPIARAVTADPRACLAMERLLRELTGLPVQERCDRSSRQSCRFIIKIPGGPGKG